ncbi:L-tryptophan--pyruvate aminotransferase 1-like [Vicia villosa]|uniref:L-tryptophan--pyruvate aminotransferase 1-like n=1 Tax=Vicia villosa TaxID=3911 RepID=UPI00273B1F67|nr:L-tryptophan--pyruvate aminotransferase 1-like [Vicia villosa]
MVVATNGSSPLEQSNGTTIPLSNLSYNSFVNVDRGDPVGFTKFWENLREEAKVEIKGDEVMSYFGDANLCWYMLPQMRNAILRLHKVVGNANTEDKYIVLGNGSSQVYLALLYALSTEKPSDIPINVVAAAPHYSEYEGATDILQSKLFQWSGDASVYDKDEPYVEVVTSPNNPDGTLRTHVVKSDAEGKVVYDLAYYWPQYTPIIHEVNQDIMLFTFSKCTGHAGSRIGWALVKDIEIAKKMVKFLHLSSIGVSKESQVRAAKIVEVICDGIQNSKSTPSDRLFFDYSKKLMKDRWEKLKTAVEQSKVFTLPKYPTAYCHFTKEITEQYPAFAWLKSVEGIEDGETYLEKLKILTRGGKRFGVDPAYVRISMIGTDDEFTELVTRLANAKIE